MSKGRERAQVVSNYKFSEEHFPQDHQLWLLAALNSVIITQASRIKCDLVPSIHSGASMTMAKAKSIVIIRRVGQKIVCW